MELEYCKIHPSYTGHTQPVLSCRDCCKLYIDLTKRINSARQLGAVDLIDFAKNKYGNFWRETRNGKTLGTVKGSPSGKDKYGRTQASIANTKDKNKSVLNDIKK